MHNSEEQTGKLETILKTFAGIVQEKALLLFELAAANKKVSIPSAAAVVVIVLALFVVKGDQARLEAAEDVPGMAQAGSSGIPVPDVPLEENAYPEVNTLMRKYYTALEEGDLDTIKSLKSYTSEEEEIRIQKKREYIASYPQVDCYTKAGPMEDSFIVYVYYEATMVNYEDVLVPGISSFFVCRNEAGNYWIFDGAVDQNVENYFIAISAQADVKALFHSADVKYDEAVNSDEGLSALMKQLPEDIRISVDEELAKLETEPEAEPPQDDAAAGDGTENADHAETAQGQETAPSVTQIVAANDVVNIRSSDSETADRLGKAEVGQRFTLLENRGNGWSKIDYDGKEAFIKTEFLTVVDTRAEENTDNAQQTANTAAPTGQTVTVKTTVNIRKSASENGEKIATAYKGETYELLMKQADGWTRINYKGQNAYVKSEFVE